MDKLSDTGDWQIGCATVHARLSHLLRTKQWADCRFLVGDEEQEEVSAHKFVLTMASPVFEAMFHGVMAEGNAPIAVPDIQPDVFKILLQFIYTDTGNIPTLSAVSELYYAAKKYMIPSIQKYCLKHMQHQLTPQNACFIYEFATLFEETGLITASLKTITRNTKNVLKASSFEDVQLSTVEMIFSQERLDINSEMDLFEAAERYARTHGLKRREEKVDDVIDGAKKPRMDEDPSLSEETKRTSLEQPKGDDDQQNLEKIKTGLRKAVSYVRFLSVSAQQFAVGAARTVLLTDEEALAVMLILVGIDVPLPKGLSGRRDFRNAYDEMQAVEMITQPSETRSVICCFSVCNFKTRKRMVRSEPFYTDEAEWRVRVVPGVEVRNGIDEKTLGVFVECNSSSSWQASVHLEIDSSVRCLMRNFRHLFTSSFPVHGYSNLLSWSAVCDAHAGYVRGNTLKIFVRIAATRQPGPCK